jgi:tetratricopeptide (TPR) repeat protein
MTGYSARDVAKMLDLSVAQIRSWVRADLIQPKRGPRGAYRFSFQDLVLLRAAKGLLAARIPTRKVRRAIGRLKEQLPAGRPLTQVRITADGDNIVVRDGRSVWNPESGQTCFDFEVSHLAQKVAPLVRRAAEQAFSAEEEYSSEDWFELGLDLEATEPRKARDAYYRSVSLDPANADAHVNLGRLLHEVREPGAAEAHYRLALAARPGDPTALFNLGVSLEDLGRGEEAIETYQEAIVADPRCADAYFNLARLYEQRGNAAKALQNLSLYRKLTRQ